MSAPEPTRKEQREAAREERRAAEAKAAREATTKKRLGIVGGIVAGAAVLVVALILLSGGSSTSSGPAPTQAGEAVPGQARTAQLLDGIPQEGRFLGDPKAPVTLVEFADLQCPFCKQYTDDVLPSVVEKYVRTGKVRLEFRPRTFIGPDSVKAAKIVVAAGGENKLWNTLELFYASQGEEGGGWVTDKLVGDVVKAVGLDPAQIETAKDAPGIEKEIKEADLLATRNGLDSTPSFLLGPTGGELAPLPVQELSPAYFAQALDQALGS